MPTASSSLSDTLLGFGLFCIVTAIVGGGFEALGYKVGPLQSLRRQVTLAIFGGVLVVCAEWDAINHLIPGKVITETFGPVTIDHGQERHLPISLRRSGPVEVVLKSINPNTNSLGIYVAICSSTNGGNCPHAQIAESQSFRADLPSGLGYVSIFNFDTNPKVTLTATVQHPK